MSHWMNVDGFVVGGQVAPRYVLWPGSGALLVKESGVVGLVSRPGLATNSFFSVSFFVKNH